jgi:hypothetical protein
MPSTSGVFKTDKDVNVVHIYTRDPAKTVQIEANLNLK